MFTKILDGKIIASPILKEIKKIIVNRQQQGIRAPVLAVILVGDNPASAIYVKNKQLVCKQVGIISKFFHIPDDTTQTQLLNLINKLNLNNYIDGILVQLPLPNTIDYKIILSAINPQKDVDGFHPQNMGLLAQGNPLIASCTSLAIMHILSTTKTYLPGKLALVIGASNIVGKPTALSLLNKGCTVTICDRNVIDIKSVINKADILVSAVGQPCLVKGNWIKQGCIIIDVGITKVNDKLVGDVEFEIAKKRASWITKVPGGVGPMTIAYLMKNTLLAQMLRE